MPLLPLLAKTKLTLATAESLTAGMVCSEIANESGISAFLKGGICAYTIESKVQLLGVDYFHAQSYNCVSEQVAQEMALGAIRLFRADIGLATTGYAEPNPQVHRPYAFWAIAIRGNTFLSGRVQGTEHSQREQMRRDTTNSVLKALEAYLNML